MGWSEWKDFDGGDGKTLKPIRSTSQAASSGSGSSYLCRCYSHEYYENIGIDEFILTITLSSYATPGGTVYVYGSDDDIEYSSEIAKLNINASNAQKQLLVSLLKEDGERYKYIKIYKYSAISSSSASMAIPTLEARLEY